MCCVDSTSPVSVCFCCYCFPFAVMEAAVFGGNVGKKYIILFYLKSSIYLYSVMSAENLLPSLLAVGRSTLSISLALVCGFLLLLWEEAHCFVWIGGVVGVKCTAHSFVVAIAQNQHLWVRIQYFLGYSSAHIVMTSHVTSASVGRCFFLSLKCTCHKIEIYLYFVGIQGLSALHQGGNRLLSNTPQVSAGYLGIVVVGGDTVGSHLLCGLHAITFC